MPKSRFHLTVCSALLLSICGQTALAQSAPPLAAPTPFEETAARLGATPETYQVEYRMIPMRDGVKLATVVLRPRADGPHPTMMVRTPYTPATELGGLGALYGEQIKRGYAFVFQNERGTNWSEGEFHLLGKVAQDGYDTLSWIARQPWSNGKVGTAGCSSSGDNQLLLGTLKHPAHAAIMSASSGSALGGFPGIPDKGYLTKGGVPVFSAWASWFRADGAAHQPKLPDGLSPDEIARVMRNFQVSEGAKPEAVDKALQASLKQLPSRDVLRRIGMPANDLDRFLDADPGVGPAWDTLDLVSPKDTGSTPQVLVNGWGDIAPFETTRLFEQVQHNPQQYLIMAPTRHCGMFRATADTKIGDRSVGDGRFPLAPLLAWYDWRLGATTGDAPAMPKVQTFLMGANTWLTGDSWPLKATRVSRLYLASGGKANSASGDGMLVPAPGRGNSFDTFASDPMNPVPSRGDGVYGPASADQHEVEARPDVLVYSTPALRKGLAVVGDIKLVLYVSADVPDTDIAVKVTDVEPDGKSYNLATTIQRLRYREGFAQPRLLTPGTVYRVEIGGMATSNFFAPGHRLRVQVAGTNFPMFERNLNTGGKNAAETAGRIATVRVLHDPAHASYLEFREFTGKVPPPLSKP